MLLIYSIINKLVLVLNWLATVYRVPCVVKELAQLDWFGNDFHIAHYGIANQYQYIRSVHVVSISSSETWPFETETIPSETIPSATDIFQIWDRDQDPIFFLSNHFFTGGYWNLPPTEWSSCLYHFPPSGRVVLIE